MRIGTLAQAANVSTKTIRYYESIGLLADPERSASGYRDYPPEALERLQFIRDAQESGLSLAEIASVLELKDAGTSSCQHTTALLARHLDDVDTQMKRLASMRSQLLALADRAGSLDPITCTDPNRCQVIETTLGAGHAADDG